MTSERCPNCEAELTNGLCPLCLIRLGIDEPLPAVGVAGETLDLPPAPGSVLDTVFGPTGLVPRVLLRDTAVGEEPSPITRPASGGCLSSRYRIDGEIARGGMGAILRGRDPDLGRDVAIKVLREDHRDNAEMVRRFVEEAQISGQLQHPGITPIYELAAFGDNRPFFSMKLVKGDTLAKLLEARKGPSDDQPRFLGIFGSIAQTVAYAHARGVIHRDLKPSNVMVGSFGEVQVMDWGLAKVLPRGGVADDATAGKHDPQESLIATARSGSDDSDLSRAGSVLGTPSYMAPEQARGEIDRVDERADVFALGSILCQILTGQPAFVGRTSGEIQRRAARSDLADALARLGACGADAELAELAKDCLAVAPDDRPRDAGVVAARGLAYQAGVQEKLRKAELQRVEERGRRRLTTAAAAAVLLLGFTVAGGYLWVHQQRTERVARTSRAIDNALTDVARLRGEAQANPASASTKLAEARSAAKGAEALLAQGEADAPLRNRVASLLAGLDREQADATEKVRRLEVDHVLLTDLEAVRSDRVQHCDPKQTDVDYAAAFRRAGLDLDVTDPAEAGEWLASRSDPAEMAGYIDDWANARRGAGRAEADWRRLVAAARGADPDPWRDALRAKFGSKDASAVAEFHRLADDTALEDQPAAGMLLLARQLKFGGDGKRAAQVLRRAALRHPGDFRIHFELAHASGDAFESYPSLNVLYPDPEEAVRHLTAAVAIRPRSVSAHVVLGMALTQRKPDEAVAECREAIRLKPDDVNAHAMLGNAFRWQRKHDEAVAECREAIRLKPDDSQSHHLLGLNLSAQGKHHEALAELREAIRLKPNYLDAHIFLGNTLKALGKSDEAVAEYREAIRLKPDSAWAHYRLGNVLRDQGKLDEAVASYREAVRLDSRAGDIVAAAGELASVLKKLGRADEVLAEWREAIRHAPDNANAHYRLGNVLRDQGKPDEAVAEYLAAIRLKPDDAAAHYRLGNFLRDQGKLDEAVASYREAVRLDSRAGHIGAAAGELASALKKLGRADEVLAELREAIRHAPDNANAHYRLGNFLRDQGKLDEAVASYREAVRLKPIDGSALCTLGLVLHAQGKTDEAATAIRQGLRLNPSLAISFADLVVVLGEGESLVAIANAARVAVEQKPDDPRLRHRLALAQIRSGDREGYRQTRVSTIERLGRSENALIGAAARACLLAPEAGDDLSVPRRLAEFAARREPRSGWIQYVLGLAYYRTDDFDRAIQGLEQSIEIGGGWTGSPLNWPVLAMAHHQLGHEREARAWLEKARTARGDRARAIVPASMAASHDWEEFQILLRQAEELIDVKTTDPAARLRAVLRGEESAGDAGETAGLAYAASDVARYATSARFFAEAFALDPTLAEFPRAGNRYNAACVAALAAAGRGKDEPPPDEPARSKLRRQALDWLKAELESWRKPLESSPPESRSGIIEYLKRWRQNGDLATLREPEALAKLPEAERDDWQALWEEVQALLKRAQGPRP